MIKSLSVVQLLRCVLWKVFRAAAERLMSKQWNEFIFINTTHRQCVCVSSVLVCTHWLGWFDPATIPRSHMARHQHQQLCAYVELLQIHFTRFACAQYFSAVILLRLDCLVYVCLLYNIYHNSLYNSLFVI